MNMPISYFLHETGNYHVTFRGQTVSFCAAYFRRLMAMEGFVVAAFVEVNVDILVQLGFSVPAGSMTKVV